MIWDAIAPIMTSLMCYTCIYIESSLVISHADEHHIPQNVTQIKYIIPKWHPMFLKLNGSESVELVLRWPTFTAISQAVRTWHVGPYNHSVPVKGLLNAAQLRIDIQSWSLHHVQRSALLQALISTTWISHRQIICPSNLFKWIFFVLIQMCSIKCAR